MILLNIALELESRLLEPKPLIQVVLGPRQVGKTTALEQVIERLPISTPSHYASADAVFRSDWSWIERQWIEATNKGPGTLLVLDEIQKVDNWSEKIKQLWDAQQRSPIRIKVVLLGSSSLALQTGLSESLTGRFELIAAHHWNFRECREGFGLGLDEYLLFGGYPGALPLRGDEHRWLSYMRSSIIETVLDKDISQLRRVTRPALFRQVFELLCNYPAAEISFRKLVGQLQDPGSIETVKHYIELLEGAFLIKTLQKFSTSPLQKRSSSPKILPLCPALCSFGRGEARMNSELRGRLFELTVGLDLLRLPGTLHYWRADHNEVDFVYTEGSRLVAIEVKSGRRRSPHGLAAFKKAFPKAHCVIISPENYEDFGNDPDRVLR
jgi:predicted AAA+ superfamily ATPase